MAQAKHKAEWHPAPARAATPDRAPPLTATGSPARALQQLLDERTAVAHDVDRWSRRRALAFIVTSSCALWLAILATAAQVVHAIA